MTDVLAAPEAVPTNWRQRVTTYRGFLPQCRAGSARDIRALWERRLADAPTKHPIWMHVHVPYCPQICSFCHCGKLLLTDQSQLGTWLDRARAEIAFFSPVLSRASITREYFGGGTPNLLAPAQLDTLFTMLEEGFDHDPTGRRTLEMLPSSYNRATLEVAARHGVRRLSCGVQSTAEPILGGVGRQPDFEPLARLMGDAHDLGIEDINVDLAWGLKDDSEELFFASLARVLALGPTTVSVHLLAPTPKHPVFGSEEEELEVYRRFRALSDGEQARKLAEAFPHYTWRKLPTVMVVVRTDYIDAGNYYTWQYSDMETVGIDMFGLGRFSLSHVLGWSRYENMTAVGRFDPDEPGYRLSTSDGVVDGAADALAELARDHVCDIVPIANRYGESVTRPVVDALDALVARGHLTQDGTVYSYHADDSLFLGPLAELLELAATSARKLNGEAEPLRLRKPAKVVEEYVVPWIEIDLGTCRVPVVVEEVQPNARYFKVVRGFGLYHGEVQGLAPLELRDAVARVARTLEDVVAGRTMTAAEAGIELAQRFAAQASRR